MTIEIEIKPTMQDGIRTEYTFNHIRGDKDKIVSYLITKHNKLVTLFRNGVGLKYDNSLLMTKIQAEEIIANYEVFNKICSTT